MRRDCTVLILVKLLEDEDEFLLCLVRLIESLDHEAHEFVKVNFPIPIEIDFIYHFLHTLLSRSLSKTL